MNNSILIDNPDRLIAKAWADEDFKTALLANPRAALKAQGYDLPEGVTLNVFENSDTVFNLVLPGAPALALVGEDLGDSGGAARCGGGGCGGGGCRCGGCSGCGGGCLCLCV